MRADAAMNRQPDPFPLLSGAYLHLLRPATNQKLPRLSLHSSLRIVSHSCFCFFFPEITLVEVTAIPFHRPDLPPAPPQPPRGEAWLGHAETI